MGFLDRFKGKNTDELLDEAKTAAGDLGGTAKDQLAEHGDDIEGAIDKVADLADQATGGKFTDKIDDAAAKLKDVAAEQAEGGQPTA